MIDLKNIINSLYVYFLNRQSDIGGLNFYTDIVQKKGINDGFDYVFKSMSSSPEYNRVIKEKVIVDLSRTIGGASKCINGLPIQHIISLGCHCLTSSLLKRNGLKPTSLPFDWMISTPGSVIHCLEDDFNVFLDRRFYSSITHRRDPKEPGADHNYYLENYDIGDMFTHRDPTCDDDYKYYIRTVSRFRRIMSSCDTKLFVMIARPFHGKTIEPKFYELMHVLRKVTSNFSLICIQLKEPTLTSGCRSMKLINSCESGYLYDFIPASRENGIRFEDDLDNLSIMQLITQFSLTILNN